VWGKVGVLVLKEEPRVIYRVVVAVDARHYVAPDADRPPVAARALGRVYS
jgi:hypothetical protein